MRPARRVWSLEAILAGGEEFEEGEVVAEDLELLADFGADVAVGGMERNSRQQACSFGRRGFVMKTVGEWLTKHPGVNVLAFERNASKSFGFGAFEEVCGFCLASHYFDGEPTERCKFCRAPLREAVAISVLAEITRRPYRFALPDDVSRVSCRGLPFVVADRKGTR